MGRYLEQVASPRVLNHALRQPMRDSLAILLKTLRNYRILEKNNQGYLKRIIPLRIRCVIKTGQTAMPPIFVRSEELGIRLEIVNGLPIWEAQPVYRHQKAIDKIRATIQKSHDTACECIHVADVYVQFPNGSLKRPDISLFCREPDEQEEAISLLPEAVIEVVSKGYEAKDLEIGPHFYLSQGIKDIIVFDPATLLVLHVRAEGAKRMVSPVDITLKCGCICAV